MKSRIIIAIVCLLQLFMVACSGGTPQTQSTNSSTTSPTVNTTQISHTEGTTPQLIINVGVYDLVDGFQDILTIHSINEETLEFSVFWYRINSIDNATAKLTGSIACFNWEDSSNGQYAEGTLEILNDGETIVMTLIDTNLANIAPGAYEYTYFGTEEEHQSSHYRSILLKNTDQEGWAANDGAMPNTTEFYLRFYEDGSYTGWVMTTFGGDGTLNEYSGKYRIQGNMLYLDGDAYYLYAESTGVTHMSLDAAGSYEVDFSGEYAFGGNGMYPYLFK